MGQTNFHKNMFLIATDDGRYYCGDSFSRIYQDIMPSYLSDREQAEIFLTREDAEKRIKQIARFDPDSLHVIDY